MGKPALPSILLWALALCLLLAACRGGDGVSRAQTQTAAGPDATPPAATLAPSPTPPGAASAPSVSPTPAIPQGYLPWGPAQVVEHLYFHSVIAYPDVAFSGDRAKSLDSAHLTAEEFRKILQSLYDQGYILVDMNDVWTETVDEAGQPRMQRQTLMLPAGKKPLILSFDDPNYYPYLLENGFTHKLILGEDGEIWSYGVDPHTGREVVSQDLDAVTILDKFVREHPDFSLDGAKGCLSLTGYSGILGYRTQSDRSLTETREIAAWALQRHREIQAVRPVIQRLLDTGWYFGCHTWGHIDLSVKSLATVQDDTQRWLDEVGSLVGETHLLFYPQGGRPDGGDVNQTGPVFTYLQESGFRIFCSMGVESYSKIKKDISAVICDRLHPDGSTLRWSRDRYLRFYDAKDILDTSVRPDLGYRWKE